MVGKHFLYHSFLWTAVSVRPAGQATRKTVCKNCAVYKQQQQQPPPPRMLFYCTNLKTQSDNQGFVLLVWY